MSNDVTDSVMFGIFGIIETLQIPLCIICIYQTLKLHKENRFSLGLLLSQLIFYISSTAFGLSRITNSILIAYDLYSRYYAWFCMTISYGIHFFALLFVLYARLRSVFDETALSLNKRTIYYIRFILTFIVIQVPIGSLLLFVGVVSYIMAILWTALWSILVLFTAQCLAWMFVCKLHKIGKEVDNVEATLLNTMKKYAILSMISVMFTTLYGMISVIFSAMGDTSYIKLAFLGLILCFDVFIDTICMALSLKINDRYYKKICFIFLCNYGNARVNQSNPMALHSDDHNLEITTTPTSK